MKKYSSYYFLALINVVITVFVVIFMLSTIFPKSTIMENGDISVDVRGIIVDYIEIQQFETNVETLETELIYLGKPIEFGKSNIVISNEIATYLNNVMFYDGAEYKITFGEVIAHPRAEALFIIVILYVAITIFLIPYLIWKLF